MAPLLLTPLGRYAAALFWDSHVSACDRGMNGSFCSAGDKEQLQPPLETPRKTAISLYSQLASLKQFSFKTEVKGHLNYQNEETTSELSHGTIQQQPAMQHRAGKQQLHGIRFAQTALTF